MAGPGSAQVFVLGQGLAGAPLGGDATQGTGQRARKASGGAHVPGERGWAQPDVTTDDSRECLDFSAAHFAKYCSLQEQREMLWQNARADV